MALLLHMNVYTFTTIAGGSGTVTTSATTLPARFDPEARKRRIVRALEDGASVRDIAATCEVTRAAVAQLLAEPDTTALCHDCQATGATRATTHAGEEVALRCKKCDGEGWVSLDPDDEDD